MPTVRRRFALAGAVAATAALTPGVAGATAASGVAATETSRTGLASLTGLAGEEHILRQVTIQPGGSTGWQWHDGTLYVYVEQGSLTHNESDCGSTRVYSDHTSFVEQSGADNVQIDRNLGTTPLVMNVLYVDPVGTPLAEDAANPGCRFQ